MPYSGAVAESVAAAEALGQQGGHDRQRRCYRHLAALAAPATAATAAGAARRSPCSRLRVRRARGRAVAESGAVAALATA